ncbi:uncharacterized protein LOC129773493 [Toxorhynchites rutilus septentrionalis]|uniref:uncharacterized protein LOC129773493 n=1 Tax=Toxorhynchites rutilus septentrionalis TaxID=329112 RepID=UPI00247A2D24|nr:uncharacterized protein LOC129773493 [Toxorhynchites rutilus septentrionalis]
MNSYLQNLSLMQELVDKLPANVRLDWALYQRQILSPDLSTFGEFMSSLVAAVSSVVTPTGMSGQKESKGHKEKVYVNVHAFDSAESNTPSTSSVNDSRQRIECVVCNKAEHKPKDCFEFRKLDVNARWKIVQGKHMCRRCLIPHGRRPCKSNVCGIDGCEYRHHKLLHSTKLNVKSKSVVPAKTSGTVSIHKEHGNSTLFRLLPVTIHGEKTSIDTFAFLDDGSELTLIDDELVRQLELSGPIVPLCMQWTGNVTRSEMNSKLIQLKISARGSSKLFPLKDVHTVADLDLPSQTLEFDKMQNAYPHLKGIPMQNYCNAKPRLLIGLNNASLNTSLKVREGRIDDPVAAKTRLGWSVYGNNNNRTISRAQHVHVCKQYSSESLHQLVQNFFSLDGCGTTSITIIESDDDQRARKILVQTTKRTSTGRFETGLLWRYDVVEFPDSRPMAERRLYCLERRLAADVDLYNIVRSQIADYQRKGYAHKLTEDESKRVDPRLVFSYPRIWYLPLGVVVNSKKPGKVRIVWDAAAKVANVSFNSMMLTGPDLLSSLLGVLFRFRQRRIAVAADIKEMFHQIQIQQDDRSSQRFLWRNCPTLPVDIFVMDVAIFGSKCSPCSSQYVKNINAKEYEHKYPRASAAIQQNHYVDDYLDSFDTVVEALQVSKEVKTVHAMAGFEMRTWLSNSEEITRNIGDATHEDSKEFFIEKENECQRVLGMVWWPEEDVFRFTVILRDDLERLAESGTVPTKRELLRFVMSFFDPLGLIAMFIIHGKTMLQDVWKSGIDWDDKITPNIYNRWCRWMTLLENLATITIPRCYFPEYDPCSYDRLELHVFADASEAAYACVAYFRITDRGRIRCMLVSSKSKVAPVKSRLQRLELQAAVIATRLAKTIASNLTITKRYFWTDSSTVLSWISSDHRRYSQYVAFRIGEILSESSIEEWRWVPTSKNVADEATKWTNANYNSSSRWFNGPEFLYDDESLWPTQKRNIETSEELRTVHCPHVEVISALFDFSRFSKYEKLRRTAAFVHYFIRCCRNKSITSNQENKSISREDLQRAEVTIFRAVQTECYSSELVKLMKNIELPWHKRLSLEKSSVLYKLTPFLDEHGVIRFESRIDNAIYISYNARNPIILPKSHIVTWLLVDSYHRKLGHSNNETVVNEFRQTFYVSNLRALVRKVSRECVWCRVYKSSPKIPRMAPLPVARSTPYVG